MIIFGPATLFQFPLLSLQASIEIDTLPFHPIGGVGQVQQPEIEFLATDKFAITQTGSRVLNGLHVSWMGTDGTFQSGKKTSELFGYAVQPASRGSLYIDVSDDSLSFTGTSTTLSAFTMGAYFWGPARNNVVWFIIVPHEAQFINDLYVDTTKWRLGMFIQHETADFASLAYSDSKADNYFDTFVFPIPNELRSGWIHLAHTYNPNESGGTLRSYVNGNLILTRSGLAWKVYGSEGAYVKLY